MRCEDYPCCGHTDGLPCDWTYTPEARAFDMAHLGCEHEAGYCEVYDRDEEAECDLSYDLDLHNGHTWCYTHDQYGDLCEPDDDPYMEDQWLDGSYEE